MDMSMVFKNDVKELYGKDFYYSRRFAKGDFNVIKPHAHQHYEIYYLTRGSRRYFIKNRFYVISPGDLLIIQPNVIHYTTAYNSDNHERILINFTSDYLAPGIEECISSICDKVCVSISDENQKKTEEIFQNISNEYNNPDEYSRIMETQCLSELLINTLRNEKNAASVIKPNNEKENGVEIILDRISKNPEENLSLDVASELAGFSKSHFSKLFKDITGFTYGNYTQMQRLFKARRLLEKTRDSVTQIAYECGFLNSGYFSTVFKDYFGMSPLEYRKDLIKPE